MEDSKGYSSKEGCSSAVNTGGSRHADVVVPGRVMNKPHAQLNEGRPLRARHQISGALQQLLLLVPPSQHFGAVDDVMDPMRDVGFGDSVDGFPLYVDEDGVMKMSGHRQHYPFAFGYDAVEDSDASIEGDRHVRLAHRNVHHSHQHIKIDSSLDSSGGTLASDSCSTSPSTYKKHYKSSKQQRGQAYGYENWYSNETNVAAGYGYPLEVHYISGSGTGAMYTNGGAPVPIDAALLRHRHVASRRRRLVGVGSNAHARSRAKGSGTRRKRSKSTQGGSSGGGGRPSVKGATSMSSPYTSTGRHGDSREVRRLSGLPTRLSGSGSVLLGSQAFLKTISGASVAVSASVAAATSIPGGFSALLSAGALNHVGSSSLVRAARTREYFLAREGEVNRRYAALRRRDARSASPGVATRGAQKAAVSDTLHAETALRTGDGADNVGSNSDALPSHPTRISRVSSLLRVSLEACDRGMSVNTGKAVAGTAFALATARSARSLPKDTPHQLQVMATTEEAVYVRAGPASALGTEVRADDNRGVAGTHYTLDAMQGMEFTPGRTTRPGQGIVTLHDPYTGLAIASACDPVTGSAEPAAAVHTRAAGIQFFRDPTAPRRSAIQLLAQSSSPLPGRTSRLLPAAYILSDGDAPLAPVHADASAVFENVASSAFSKEPLAHFFPHTASLTSALCPRPSFARPLAISFSSSAAQLHPFHLSGCSPVVEGSGKLRSPRSLVMGGPPSSTSQIQHDLWGRDIVTSKEKEGTGVATLSYMASNTRTNATLMSNGSLAFAARDEHAGSDALPMTTSSEVRRTGSLCFGDGTRVRSELPNGASAVIYGDRTTAAHLTEEDSTKGAENFPRRWRHGVSGPYMGRGEGHGGVEKSASRKSDATAPGWCGVWPTTFHGRGAPRDHFMMLATPRASNSLSATKLSSASPHISPPLQIPFVPASIASYTPSHHPQHNIRHNAWTAEGVSASSNTSCVVHVFTISRKMLHSVYEYVAYMCVAKRHAEFQQRRREHEERLKKELSASGLTGSTQWHLRCPHCGVLGQVVRYSTLQHKSLTGQSGTLFEMKETSQRLWKEERHHRHHNAHHSRTPHTSPMSTIATTTTATPPPAYNTPQQLAHLSPKRRQQRPSHPGLGRGTQGSGGNASTAVTSCREERLQLASSWPQYTRGAASLANGRDLYSNSSEIYDREVAPLITRMSPFPLGAAMNSINSKRAERQIPVRALSVDDVGDTLPSVPTSCISQSSPSPPTLGAPRTPLTAPGGSGAGSLTVLPPLAQCTPPFHIQSAYSSPDVQQSSAGAAVMLPSPTSTAQQPLIAGTAAVFSSPSFYRVHGSSRVLDTQGTTRAGITNSSGARVETLPDSSGVGGELSRSFRQRSPLHDLNDTVADRNSTPSSKDGRATRQQAPAIAVAQSRNDTLSIHESAAAASRQEHVEGGGNATAEIAAGRRLSSRVELSNSTTSRNSPSILSVSNDTEDRRSDYTALVQPPPTGSPDHSKPVDISTHDATAARSISAVQLGHASPTDSPLLCGTPPAAVDWATATTKGATASLKAHVTDMGSYVGSKSTTEDVSHANTVFSTMGRCAPKPLCDKGDEGDKDDQLMMKCRGDTDAQEAEREDDQGGGAWYVCHSCHCDVIPKRTLLTSGNHNRLSSRLLRESHPTNSGSSRSVGDEDTGDDKVDAHVSADAAVITFEDLLQDDALVHALHTSLCEALMMPATQEPRSLLPFFSNAPPHTNQAESAAWSSAPMQLTGRSSRASAAALPQWAGAHRHGSSMPPSMEKMRGQSKGCRGAGLPMKPPTTPSSPGVPSGGLAVMRTGDVVASESVHDNSNGDNQDAITQQPREMSALPLLSDVPTSPPTLSTWVSPKCSSQEATSDACSGSSEEAGSDLSAASRIRISLPCCGLTVNVLPCEAPLLPAASPSASAVGGERRELAERHAPPTGIKNHKKIGGARLRRRRFTTSVPRPQPEIPRMREDAATRGLTPSAMLMSSAACSHSLDQCNERKVPKRLCDMRNTSKYHSRRHMVGDTAAKRPNLCAASPSGETAPPNVAAVATTMAPVMKGTISSEKHRVQVNRRTPLDALSKKRIMERIFHQNWLNGNDSITYTAPLASAQAPVTVGAASRFGAGASRFSLSERRNGEPPASSASAGTALTKPPAPTVAVDDYRGTASKVGGPASRLRPDAKMPRRHRRAYFCMQEQAQLNADFLLPPRRVPKPLGVDLDRYRDSGLVLEIDLAYPRLPRGNVRELLVEWRDTCQPHPVLVEAVIRNIIFAVLVQLSDLHAAGRTHGSVKSTNAFPLWHAMKGTRESGLVMPSSSRRRVGSPTPSTRGQDETTSRPEYAQGKDPATTKTDSSRRRQRKADVDGEGADEVARTHAAALPAQNLVRPASREYASKRPSSTVTAADIDTTPMSLRNPRQPSDDQQRRTPRGASGPIRTNQQIPPRHREASAPGRAMGRTGAIACAQMDRKAPLSPSPCEIASATTLSAPADALSTAMVANPFWGVQVSLGSSGGADTKPDSVGTHVNMTASQSHASTGPSSPSAAFPTSSGLIPVLQSRGGVSADTWCTDTTPLCSADSISISTALSPVLSLTSSHARPRGGGRAAARLRRGSIATNLGCGDDRDYSIGDAVDKSASMLVPLVAECLIPPRALLCDPRATKTTAAAAAAVDATDSKKQLQKGPWGAPYGCSPAESLWHRSDDQNHFRGYRRSGSWSAAVEDPNEWLACAVPRRYVRGVEIRPPAAVWFPPVTSDKPRDWRTKTSGGHHTTSSVAKATLASDGAPDSAAEPVITKGPTGAVPQPQLGRLNEEAASPHETVSSDRTRRRSSSAGPSTGSPAALHGDSSISQDAPDPLQWSRQVLLVENLNTVVATALRNAMACVLMQCRPHPHTSHLPSSALLLNSETKSKSVGPGEVLGAANDAAKTATRTGNGRSLCSAASARPVPKASSMYLPDVVNSPPPLPPKLFALQHSEYVPAPELLHLSDDDARSLRRLWHRQCSNAPAAAAADGVVNEKESGDRFGLLRGSTSVTLDTGVEDEVRLREILDRVEATESPGATLRHILDPCPSISAAVDIWQLGIMALELADGPPPTTWMKPCEPVPALRVYPWSSYFHSFVSLCLQRAPEKRGTAVELLQHPWFTVALLPQSSSTSPSMAFESSGEKWGQGLVRGGIAVESFGASILAASRQNSKTDEGAPIHSPSFRVRAPGVMGVDCLTPEERAEWENFDYTLLYASHAQLNHPLTKATASAASTVAGAGEHHGPSADTGLPAHDAREDTAYPPRPTPPAHDSHSAIIRDAMSILSASSPPGGEGKRSVDTLLSRAAAVTGAPAHSSARTLPSVGARATVALSSTAAPAITTTKASANDELLVAVSTVDLAKNFVEYMVQQWALQPQHLVSSRIAGSMTYGGFSNGRQSMSLIAPNCGTPAVATTPIDGANPLFRPVMSTRSTTSTGEAAPAYTVLTPALLQPSTGQGAMSGQTQQQRPVLLFSQISRGDRKMPIWRGHRATLGNNTSLGDPVAVFPVASSSGSPSPLLLTPRDFWGGGGMRVLHNPSHLRHPSPHAAQCDVMMRRVAANDLAPRWTARRMGQWDGIETMSSQPRTLLTPSSAEHSLWSPRLQLTVRGAAGDTASAMNTHPSWLSRGADDVTGTERDRAVKHQGRINLGNDAALGGARSGSGDLHCAGNMQYPRRREEAISTSCSAESSYSSKTHSDSTVLTLSPDDATRRDVTTLSTAGQRGSSDEYLMICDPTRGNGGDDHHASPPLFTSHSTHRLLNGAIATALARLSAIAYPSCDSEEQWDSGTTSSSSDDDDDDRTSFTDRSDCTHSSPKWGAPRFSQTTKIESVEIARRQHNGPGSGDAIGSEKNPEDLDRQPIGAQVLCDELLRCASALQQNCPVAVSLWCVRVLQRAMQNPRTRASAARILERIENTSPAEGRKHLEWLKQPNTSLSTASDVIGAAPTQSAPGAAMAASDGSFSHATAGVTSGTHQASGTSLPPEELDASPSSFHNYEVAKWIYSLHQTLPRCT